MDIAARLLSLAEDALGIRLSSRLRAWDGSVDQILAVKPSSTGKSGMPSSPKEWLS